MAYSISPQKSQDSFIAELRRAFPAIPIIPDGLPEGEYAQVKLNPDGSVQPFVVVWFHVARRTPRGRSFSTTRLDQRQTGCDLIAVANNGTESRRILNGVTDHIVGFKPEGSGIVTEADTGLWDQARPMDIANRPARWLTTTTLQWGINHQKVD